MADEEEKQQALIVGGGAIGSALAARWAADSDYDAVWTVGRQGSPAPAAAARHLSTDHSEADIARCTNEIVRGLPALSRVVITLGTLHGDGYAPEKSLQQLRGDAMLEVHRVNCLLPLLWLAALAPQLRNVRDCRVAVLSARVGSIADNNLGGWYSYRSSKAALNMGLRCAAIELARSARGVKLVAYHPGTVDSPLSAPFQARVPEGKLFSAERAAAHLDAVLAAQRPDGELAYLDWAGESIPW